MIVGWQRINIFLNYQIEMIGQTKMQETQKNTT